MHAALDLLRDITIEQYRITKLFAEKYAEPTETRGYLDTSVTLSVGAPVKNDGSNTTLSRVQLTVIGMPGEKPEKRQEAKNLTPHFKIEVQVEGVVKWKEMPPEAILADDNLTPPLCRSVYLIAAVEAKNMAIKLGITGFKLNMDLQATLREADTMKSAPPAKKSTARAVAKKQSH